MSGLLDYMADVTMDSHEEIDAPAVGYGNELLWEDIKVDPANTVAPAPVLQKRKSRSHKGK